jgi:hypothetical protein
MNNDLVIERGILLNAMNTKLQIRQVIPGRDQNGKLVASGLLLMPECDHTDTISVFIGPKILQIPESPSG